MATVAFVSRFALSALGVDAVAAGARNIVVFMLGTGPEHHFLVFRMAAQAGLVDSLKLFRIFKIQKVPLGRVLLVQRSLAMAGRATRVEPGMGILAEFGLFGIVTRCA